MATISNSTNVQAHIPTQQTGAPVLGNVSAWNFLFETQDSDTCIDTCNQILKESMKKLITHVTPLKMHGCDTKQTFVQMYKSMVGFIELPDEAQINPFIPVIEGTCVRCEPVANNPSHLDVENALRSLMLARYDSLRGTLFVLDALPEAAALKVKRACVLSLEKDPESWSVWKKHAGCIPEQLSDYEKRVAIVDKDRFWKAVNDLYVTAVDILRESAASNDDDDVEKLLFKWRDLDSYALVAKDWDDVLDHERLLFGQLSSKLVLTWETRRELLNTILARFGISSICDLYTIELSEFNEYDWFILVKERILKLCRLRNLRFTYATKPKEPKAKIPTAKPSSKTLLGPCEYCHMANHHVSECRRKARGESSRPIESTPSAQQKIIPGRCYTCGGANHWSPECPMKKTENHVKFTGCYNCGDVNHWSKNCPRLVKNERSSSGASPEVTPASLDALPDSAVAQTRSGRHVKPTQRFSLATQSEIEDYAQECSIDDDAPSVEACNHVVLFETPLTTFDVASDADVGIDILSRTTVKATVGVRCNDHEFVFAGLVDTGSGINYVTRSVVAHLGIHESVMKKGISVCTMNGKSAPAKSKVCSIDVSLLDACGRWSSPIHATFMISEQPIPGGADFLLHDGWIVQQNLTIVPGPNGCEVRFVYSPAGCDREVQTCDTDTPACLYAFAVDPPEDDNELFSEDAAELSVIIPELRDKAMSSGPLSKSDLDGIWDKVHDPPATLLIKEGHLDPPIQMEGYPVSPALRAELLETVETLVSQGILQQVPRGSGVWASPGFAVRKANGKARLVCDYTKLNSRIECPKGVSYHDAKGWWESIPSYSKYYSVLDVRDAFYRIKLHKSARPYLHIRLWGEGAEYEWTRLPQGLSTSPAWWCALIESVAESIRNFLLFHPDPNIRELLNNTVIVCYADDILIAGENSENVKRLSELVYQVLSYGGMYIPDDKFQRVSTNVRCMGLKLEAGTIGVDDDMVQRIVNMTRPTDKKQLRSCLGLLNYVRWSLPDAATSLAPLQTLLSSDKRFTWGAEQESCWRNVVENFRATPLNCFCWNPNVEDISGLTLVLQTDASEDGLGYSAILVPALPDSLLQQPHLIDVRDFGESMKIISCGSKRFDAHERRYTPHDREAYAIFVCLNRYRKLIYLFGSCVLQTDNKISVSRFTKLDFDEPNCTRARRWLRWVHDLADLLQIGGRIRFAHIAGEQNSLADYFSRYILNDLQLHESSTQTDLHDSITISLATIATNIPSDLTNNSLTELSRALTIWTDLDDSEYLKAPLREIYKYLRGDPDYIKENKLVSQIAQRRFSIDGDILMFHNSGDSPPLIVVPDSHFSDNLSVRVYLIRYFHEGNVLACHRGIHATLSAMRKTYWFPLMDKRVNAWISSCAGCTVSKYSKPSSSFSPRQVSYPNQFLYTDWAGPFCPHGLRYCLLLVDGFSGFSLCIPYANKSSECCADGILQWISLLGTPTNWCHDNDPSYCSKVAACLRQLLGIRDISSPTYSPMSQGSVERMVRTMKEAINACCYDDETLPWHLVLKAVVWTSNSVPRYGTDLSPFTIMIGRQPVDPMGSRFEIIDDGADVDEYVTKLRSALVNIQSYWASKIMEIRNSASDSAALLQPDVLLDVGDKCARFTYIHGRRQLLETCRIVSRESRSTYKICGTDGNPRLCHGYQLVRIDTSADRDHYESLQPPTPKKISPFARFLKRANVGDPMIVENSGEISLALLAVKYLTGHHVEILTTIALGDGRFRLPKPSETDRFRKVVDIDSVYKIPVDCVDCNGIFTVPSSQFGGSVA